MATVSYKCPNCDAGLVFDPTSQKFICEYCLSKYTQEELDALNNNTEEKENTEKENTSEEFIEYSCPSCGAEIVTDATTAATFCYYCHNPVLISNRLQGTYKPDKIVPFTINREQAVEEFLKWTKQKWFIPKYFFSKEQIDKITGVYFPHWVVDSDVTGKLDAQGRKIFTWVAGDMQYTQTKNYKVVREAAIHYEDITKSALSKANKELVDGIHPFDDKSMVDFSMAYLSGFQAEKRDVEKEELEQEIADEVAKYTKMLVDESAGEYIGITGDDVEVGEMQNKWSYTLLPVWTLTYKSKNGKLYYYAMNGQSGKICGRLPMDFGKLLILFAGVAIPVFACLMIGGYFI